MATEPSADKAMRVGTYDVECEHGTARVHVNRDRSAAEIVRLFGALAETAPEAVVADAA